MIRFAAALLLLGAPPQDDLGKRVRALVEQFQADEIQAVDDAMAGLIALGPPALEAIRQEHKKSAGDARLRLEEVLRKIERNVKRGRALGTPVLVTLDAKEKPLPEALEEIRKATGQPLVFEDLPADKVTLALDKVGFWEALDRLCKAHGGVMWEVVEKEIVVSKRPYRDLPKVFRGNQVVFFSRLTSDQRLYGVRSEPSLYLEGGFAWTKGSIVPRESFVVEEFTDDQGTDLRAQAAGGATFTLSEEEAMEPGQLTKSLGFSETGVLHDKASKLARLKGSLRLEYVLESRKIASFERPAGRIGKPQREGSLTVTIKSFSASENDVDANVTVEVANAREKLLIRASGFRLIDSKGAAHAASGWVDEDVDEDTGKIDYDCDLEFKLPDKTVIVALEFTVPTDLEEIVIPFDFKDLPLK